MTLPSPRFSIVTPVYEPPADVLEAMLESVAAQTFPDWELCLADDASPSPHVREILTRWAQRDSRIKVAHREQNGGIVAASNDALALAGGEYVVLLDNDDELHPDALAHIDRVAGEQPHADYIYSDEDKIDRAGQHSGPFFKPGWSPERFRTQMYTCHISVLRRALVEEVGGFDAEFEGSQDWDLVLRVTEKARSVAHIPHVLYHWRTLETSAAGGGEEAKPWAFEAGTRAVQAHCDRIGLPAKVERDLEHPGVYHLNPDLKSEPLVSLIIPTNATGRQVWFEQRLLVAHCVESVLERSTYSNLEIVCVVDETVPESTLEQLREIGGDRVVIAPFEGPFNFSAKINRGAVHSQGEHLLLLNDDMEVITPDWIERLVMYSSQDEIGAVGARLLFQDGRIQHAGIEFHRGLPGHQFRGFSRDFSGYSNSARVAQNLLAVTGACLMSSRDNFFRVGGLSTELPLNYNDIDFCLKLHSQGLRNVFDPDCELYHFESSSRETEVKDWEKDWLLDRWGGLTAGDPYANPHLLHGSPRITSGLAWAARSRILPGKRALRKLAGRA